MIIIWNLWLCHSFVANYRIFYVKIGFLLMKFPFCSFMAIFDVSTFFTLANQEAVVNGRQPYRYVIVGKPILEKECVKQRPISTTLTADFISLNKIITFKKQGNKNFTWSTLTLFTGQYWTLIDTRKGKSFSWVNYRHHPSMTYARS